MNLKIQAVLAEVRGEFDRIYGERLEQIMLFGSQARGDAQAASDVDLLVVLKGEVIPGEEIAATGPMTSSLSLKYDVVISCTFVSATRFAYENTPLLLNIRREGLRL